MREPKLPVLLESMPESTIAIVGVDRFAAAQPDCAPITDGHNCTFEYDGDAVPARGHTLVGDDLGHIRTLRQREDLLAGQARLQTVDRAELLLDLDRRPTERAITGKLLVQAIRVALLITLDDHIEALSRVLLGRTKQRGVHIGLHTIGRPVPRARGSHRGKCESDKNGRDQRARPAAAPTPQRIRPQPTTTTATPPKSIGTTASIASGKPHYRSSRNRTNVRAADTRTAPTLERRSPPLLPQKGAAALRRRQIPHSSSDREGL